ncbi:MAG TPA: magnesium-translocating P-type ATPase [Natronincola sp.]|nr:magnesium-translocating P-type ATPase [Natronincola sp.]
MGGGCRVRNKGRVLVKQNHVIVYTLTWLFDNGKGRLDVISKKATSLQAAERRDKVTKRLLSVTQKERDALLLDFKTSMNGLEESQVEIMRDLYGGNEVSHGEADSWLKKIIEAFVNPFTIILFALAAVSYVTDVALAPAGEKDFMTVIIIMTLVLVSGVLRFVQEARSGNAAARLREMILVTTAVERIGTGKKEINLDEVVVGDIVHLAAGDMVPADLRILQAKDLFISQAALTGESEPVEKFGSPANQAYPTLTDYPNLAFMGTNVISGAAIGVVIATGDDTVFGDMAVEIVDVDVETSFEKGVNSVSWVLIRFMLAMVPIVLFINGFTKGNWMEAFLFAISIAVGLTPEMLPMIVTASLARGAVTMSEKKTIIKNLNSIQNLGSIDILCTDKTGTLTQDRVALQYYLDVHGESSARVLRHGFLNSYFQTGLKNLIDLAIIERTQKQKDDDEPTLQGLEETYTKVDEIPFDFERRRMSVVVEDKTGKTQMVTKGAVEEMLSICSFVEYEGKVESLTQEIINDISKTVGRLNDDGMRVIAVAQKTNPSPVGEFSVADETEMVLIGYLAFLDPPKETTADAIKGLRDYGVTVKVLTGDNERVTQAICAQVGLPVDGMLLGTDVEGMDDATLSEAVEKTTVFAKLSPTQKARVVTSLRNNGHSVGYLGDGINDAAAMKSSDVGISVNNAVDIAKESADVILLEKDLTVLEEGIIEGRKTYANMIKYIKMTASSNFGNVFSVLIASAFLPFLPMAAIHLVLLNLIYDISCIALPWDNVDEEYLKLPRKWDASSISSFMLWIGPTSSIFDVTTFALMYFIIAPAVTGGQLYSQITDPAVKAAFIAVFQAGWFVESMWSQTLVIHMIRTPKIPFLQSRASTPVTVLTFAGIAFLTLIPFSALGASIGLAPLPPVYFAWLALTVVLYMALAQRAKNLYVRRYGELL